MATEDERAKVSQERGQAASGIRDSEERKKFISRQGEEERSGREDLGGLAQDAYRQRNVNAVQSFKRGGKVKRTGIYKLHKGERVTPRKTKRARGRR